MTANTIELNVENFEATTSKGTVFIDFWAAWCGPCRYFAPVYEAVAKENPGIVFGKVDTEDQEALGERFEVQSIPTLMAFVDGVEVHRSSGAIPKQSLEALVNRVKLIDITTLKKSKELAARSLKGEKPPGVPTDATWDAGDNEWCAGGTDDDDKKHGVWKYWRPDGTLCCESHFVHGMLHGPFKRFHENGEVSSTGAYDNGKLHGTRAWIASDAYTTERMHEQGISDKVRRIEMDYDHDRVVAIRHFNAQRVRCLPTTGEPYPNRPTNVSSRAEYNERSEQWELTQVDAERNKDGLCKAWSTEGTLLWEGAFERGVRHGRWMEEAAEEFADGNVVTLHGSFDQGRPVGVWSGRDSGGKSIFSRDLGIATPVEEVEASLVAKNIAQTGAAWRALAKTYQTAKKYDLAILALVRASASDRDFKALEDAFKRMTLPRNTDSAMQTSEGDMEGDVDLQDLAISLLKGGHPGAVLMRCAVVTDESARPRAALDFINAAVMLYPAQRELLFTRAIILASLGLEAHARVDAETLVTHGFDTGTYMLRSLTAHFPQFGFWPEREKPESTYDGLPEAPVQSLQAIEKVIRVYATRLMLCREAILKHFTPGVSLSWLPPDVSKLLPQGKVTLSKRTLQGEDEDEDVEIDETLDPSRHNLRQLVRLARADWNALCWLSWATGLSEVGLPTKISAPKDFGLAAGMASQRLWRSRDRRATKRTFEDHQIAGFAFEGVDIDQLPPQIASIAEQQYAEMQALFYWLSDEANESPWQDNLRGS